MYIIICMGSAVAGGFFEAYYWAEFETRSVVRKAVGASCFTMGLATVRACTPPEMLVPVWSFGIVLPIWLETTEVAIWTLVAFSNGWLPGVGHLGHFGGKTFGGVLVGCCIAAEGFGTLVSCIPVMMHLVQVNANIYS
jgi:membrane associated rhomboid family serine protease